MMKRDAKQSTGVRLFFLAIKLAVGLSIVYWLIDSGRLNLTAYQSISFEKIGWLIVGVIVAQATSLTLVLARWWLLVRAQGVQISLTTVLRISYRGMFAGLLVPGTLGLDGVRILHLHRHHPGELSSGLASMMIDRALGLLGLLILAVACGLIFFLGHSNQHALEIITWLILGLVSLTIIIAVACGFIPMKGMRILRKSRFLCGFVDALAIYSSHHGTLATAVFLSIVAHFLVSVGSCFGLAVLDLDFSVMAIATVTPLLIVIRFIPLTPLGLGITDFAGEELFHAVGIAGGAEVQMLLRGTWILVLIACGLAYFGEKKANSYHC